MKVSELGEFGLINLINELVRRTEKESPASNGLILGIGDDAASWQGDNSVQLATVDALVQNVHFTPETSSWEDIGWKSLAVNLSDIAAMGGQPRYALVSLTLPPDTDAENVLAMYEGMLNLAGKFETAIIGGNISSAPIISITITVFGVMPPDRRPLMRSLAKPGDLIAVTGFPGTAAAGLAALRQMKKLPAHAVSLTKAFRTPYPRITQGQLLVKHGVKAAIDISDGLAADLRHICRASQVGATVHTGRLPLHPDVKMLFGDQSLSFAIAGGEDYELLFTARADTLKALTKESDIPITIIGEITKENAGMVTFMDAKGNAVSPPSAGWEHFTQHKDRK